MAKNSFNYCKYFKKKSDIKTFLKLFFG